MLPRSKKQETSPRSGSKATIKRNSETWDSNNFAAINASRRLTIEDTWARLVSTNPAYPNINVVKDEIFFGRRDDADVHLQDGAVSNSHCRLWREREKESKARETQNEEMQANEEAGDEEEDATETIWLEDLSTNGTFIQDKRIGKSNKVQITSGTEITLIPRGHNRKKVSYIIYLPKLEREERAPEGDVTFVFTDVQSSTVLWEKAPDAMNDALKRHDKILRRLLRKYGGYEVKTEGDAFMVAFFSVLDAIMWCLAVQKALVRTSWPAQLLGQPAARVETDSQSRVIFAGIRVRMGIHTGKPNCRRNPVTGRMDYFGSVVNRSARISDSAHGGQIVLTQEVKDELDHSKTQSTFAELFIFHDDYQCVSVGTYSYKGIPEPIQVYQIFSHDLAERTFPPLRSEEYLRLHKQNAGHKLLVDESDDHNNANNNNNNNNNSIDSQPLSPKPARRHDESISSTIVATEPIVTCANPGCGQTETIDTPFGACARCKTVKYCGVDCQKAHWKVHKKQCGDPHAQAAAHHKFNN